MSVEAVQVNGSCILFKTDQSLPAKSETDFLPFAKTDSKAKVREKLIMAMEATYGNQTKAKNLLGISQPYVSALLKAHKINWREYRKKKSKNSAS